MQTPPGELTPTDDVQPFPDTIVNVNDPLGVTPAGSKSDHMTVKAGVDTQEPTPNPILNFETGDQSVGQRGGDREEGDGFISDEVHDPTQNGLGSDPTIVDNITESEPNRHKMKHGQSQQIKTPAPSQNIAEARKRRIRKTPLRFKDYIA